MSSLDFIKITNYFKIRSYRHVVCPIVVLTDYNAVLVVILKKGVDSQDMKIFH
jgi:hypothetical protein